MRGTERRAILSLGEAAPDFVLPGTDGQSHSLASFAGDPYLVVAFLANHCPYTAAWEGRLVALARRYARKGVAFAAISSSDVERFPADTLAHMAERARDRRFPFPYLYDGEQAPARVRGTSPQAPARVRGTSPQAAARAFGATHTPHVFLFDTERRLRYRGAIDSDWQDGPGTVRYLHEAIEALLSGRDVPVAVTEPVGCRIRLRD